MNDDYGRPRGKTGRRTSGSRPRGDRDGYGFEDDDRDDDGLRGDEDEEDLGDREAGYDDGGETPRFRPPRAAVRRGAPPRGPVKPPRSPSKPARFGFFGGSNRNASRRRSGRRDDRDEYDWGAAQYEEDDRRYDRDDDEREGRYADYDDAPPRRRRGPPARARRRERQTLLELCTPVFGYAAILPREGSGVHPGFQQFQQEVLSALEKIKSEARDNSIDPEDADEARYALCLFMDEQVADSEWSGRDQWATQPLHMTVVQDPEGGVNFFTRLEGLGERQRAVKEVYLVCLALGFRGKYAELDPAQQAARIGEIRQKLLRSIHPFPMDNQEVLFPEAYEPAMPIEEEAPPPPRWWLYASLGAVGAVLFIYLVLLWVAGSLSSSAIDALRRL